MSTTEANDAGDAVASSNENGTVQPVDTERAPRLGFAVVGVGASAGGLEAYTGFLKAMPADSGMAFVFIQHLSPSHESMMAELLGRQTRMRVVQVEDGMEVEPNVVYVIRPGHTMTLREGKLRLGESLLSPGHRRPVDDFFRSLADEQRERAIGVILSGMGSNGTAGAQAIKAVGGLIIAQDPETAKYPAMPRSLIEAGLADAILRVEEIPDAVMRYAQHPYAKGTFAKGGGFEAKALGEILAVLRARTRHDFTGYKKPTLLRRVERRMGLSQLESIGNYSRFLRQTPAEVSALADDMLIHVTGFFRDPDAWEALRQRVIDPLVRERENGQSIRAWVTACSSGEEAYTLAMLLAEAADTAGKRFDIKVFATDPAERALAMARSGTFAGGIEGEIAPERLERYFDKDDAFFRIKKEIRELVIFAPQNLLQDPPFSKLDICTCRNLLIYLEPEVQRRVMALLHFGLREGGTLFLGNSETVGTGFDGMFEAIDKKWRLFRRVGPTRHGSVEFPVPMMRGGGAGIGVAEVRVGKASVGQTATRMLLEHHTPAAAVVDREGTIVYFHGNTDKFLEQPRGEPTRDLLVLAKESVRGAVRTALQRAASQGEAVTVRDGAMETEGVRVRVEVVAEQLTAGGAAAHFLVSFLEHAEPPASVPAKDETEEELRADLARVRDELQSTIEELQTSNEEMKASGEETTSINEELQSANEELETSKEELQSLNEELTTVNAQLQAKVEEVERTGNDLASLLASTDIAVVFLDTKLRIRRYTPAVGDLIDVIPSDIGRPLNDLALKFEDEELQRDARQVLERLVPVSREIASKSGREYLRRVLPYRTNDNRIDGVVITFVDITDRKRAEATVSGMLAREQAARVEVEAALAEKDQFLATVSHELRTPLSAVLLWAKLLQSGSAMTAEQQAEGMGAIVRSAKAQQALIEDLLDTARITTGKFRIDLRVMDLGDLVRQMLEAGRPAVEAKGLTLATQVEDVGRVRVDGGRIEQVVTNLLQNAVKFTPRGGRIEATLRREGNRVILRFSDTGKGMPAEALERIFERFHQVETLPSMSAGGLGLGLSICRQIVEMHGGTIRADSGGEGKGATFTVTLPLPALTGDKDADESVEPMESLRGLKVLLVEDDASTREATRLLLMQAGAEVSVAGSAEEALAAFEKERPGLLLSDIGLTDHDGNWLMRQVRSLETMRKQAPTPAVALTAFANDRDRALAAESGFDRHLSKPVDPVALVRLLNEMQGR